MSAPAPDIVTRRIYEPATPDDGSRVLIMRLWPRGIRKERVSVWLKELGPVPELLRAYLDETITWEQYVPRYLAGLERPEAQAAIAEVRRRAAEGRVTLLCGCPDQARCHRTLLRTYLLDSARGATPRPRRSADKPRRRRPRPRHAGRRRARGVVSLHAAERHRRHHAALTASGGTAMTAKSRSKGMKAYVLIETAPGKTKAVRKELASVSKGALATLDAVTGPYDFIAVVEGPTLDAIGRLVTDEIGAVNGVTRTTTCVAISLA